MRKKFFRSLCYLGSAMVIGNNLTPIVHAEELVSAKEPEKILEIAKGFGIAHLEDVNKNPVIIGRIQGKKYAISFHGCNSSGKDCDDILFTAPWSGESSLERVNNWNREKRFGRAYIDTDGDPALDMAVNIDYGVTTKNIEDTFDWWSKAMSRFEEQVVNNK